ncbi:MAG: 1-acyl-sn-glycerol-3-phosphate acyltransferase [Clostridiales bacterium]|jgi:1-acyl-sn-glycerol-3-phosphate acyltransferase|nr:1-acyl-sn-glycerol-3-phosphate acyltransferase [Clostridiales bacterium]
MKKNTVLPFAAGQTRSKKLFVDFATSAACAIVKTVFRNKIINKTQIDYSKNYLILCAHGSGLDFLHTKSAFKHMDIAIVAARKLFFGKITGLLMRIKKAIPKKQFIADLLALRLIRNASESGKSVFICPEGRSTPDGKNSFISPAVSKMIKWLNLPVLFVKPQGSYLSFPRWAKSVRFGKMTTEVSLLLSKNDINTLSSDEIYERVKEAFIFNEYDYQIKNKIKFHTLAPAKNIQRLLFVCPECKSSINMESGPKHIFCAACGLKAHVGTDASIKFKKGDSYFNNINEWIEFEKRFIADLVAHPDFSYEIKTDLDFENESTMSYKKIAEGALNITRAGITFRASKFVDDGLIDADKEKYSNIFYPASALSGLSYATHNIELYAYENSQIYKFADDVVTYKLNLIIEAVFNAYGCKNTPQAQ